MVNEMINGRCPLEPYRFQHVTDIEECITGNCHLNVWLLSRKCPIADYIFLKNRV